MRAGPNGAGRRSAVELERAKDHAGCVVAQAGEDRGRGVDGDVANDVQRPAPAVALRIPGAAAADTAPASPPARPEQAQRVPGAVVAHLARLADFAARRAELATEEAEYLAELARIADPGLAAGADPSVHAPVTTGLHHAAPEQREYLTQGDVADLLGAHVRTIRRMELCGELPEAIEIGRLKRWRRSTVQTWLDEGCPKPRRPRR